MSQKFLIPSITQPFDVHMALPGSKSIALRQLAISALCEGKSRVSGIPPCDDTKAMIQCLSRLGVKVKYVDHTTVTICGPINLSDDCELDAHMSGASTRLLIGLAALRQGTTYIDGHHSLRQRTNAPLYAVLREHGCQIENQVDGLPVSISGPIQAPDQLRIDGSLSSQYISALLLTAPLLQPNGQRIELTSNIVSRPYIDITLNEMRKRGVAPRWESDRVIYVPPGHYQSADVTVEGDATAASYFLGLATLHASRVILTNLGDQTVQGDHRFIDVLQQLGALVNTTETTTTLQGPKTLSSIDHIDLTSMPDAAMTLFTLAPFLPKPIHITGLSTLKHKECDRLACPEAELAALGIRARASNDAISIEPLGTDRVQAYTLSTYHDHRMAMAFSLIGSRSGTLSVDDKTVVAKTYPHYWEDYDKLVNAT